MFHAFWYPICAVSSCLLPSSPFVLVLGVLQERERKERERAVRAKVAACAFARGYLGGIVKNVFQQLQDTGYFYDPVEREVRDSTDCGASASNGHV
jgi:hypothetical protein